MRSVFVALALFLTGCGHTIYTPLEGDPSAPLPRGASASKGEFCVPDADGKYDLEKTTMGQVAWEGALAIAYGGGCVGRSLIETQAALHNKAALHWVNASLEGFARLDDDRAPFVFETKYKAGPPVFAQTWTMQWFHSEKDGQLFVRFKKTAGTSYIPRWDGTIELTALTPTVTSFTMRNEIEAARTGLKESEGSVRDQLTRARTIAADYAFLKP